MVLIERTFPLCAVGETLPCVGVVSPVLAAVSEVTGRDPGHGRAASTAVDLCLYALMSASEVGCSRCEEVVQARISMRVHGPEKQKVLL